MFRIIKFLLRKDLFIKWSWFKRDVRYVLESRVRGIGYLRFLEFKWVLDFLYGVDRFDVFYYGF